MDMVQMLTVITTVLFSIVSFFLVRTLRQIDRNQQELFNRLREVEISLAKLMAEHNLMLCKLKEKGGN